jgi:hypothetical protein
VTAVKGVGAVAGRACEDHRTTGAAVVRSTNAVMDPFIQRLVQPVVQASIKIYPALSFVRRFAGDKQYFRPQQACVPDEIPSWLDDDIAESGIDCFGVGI